MTKEQLQETHRLNGMSDIDMLNYLLTVCNEEDKKEVQELIDINWKLFIDCVYDGNTFGYYEMEQEYFDRKYAVLVKYDDKENWVSD